ncbi:MAG TPA: helix-turn-helix transcriptional regulator [Streptosporangiaceae bacterium]|nr:helix-turn-helix transcriptional regulator [Streptosporangiaceae bacterium]
MASDRSPIGDQIRRARHRKRWTQRQLAARVGVDRKTIDNWENDRSYPRTGIGALEDALGITLDGHGPRPREAAETELDATITQLRQTLDWLLSLRGRTSGGDHPRAS